MPTLIDGATGMSGRANSGSASNLASGGDAASARQTVLDAANSGDGRVRLTTQAGNAAEVAALVLLTGSAVVLGSGAADVLTEAGIDDLTAASTWDEAVTAIAAS